MGLEIKKNQNFTIDIYKGFKIKINKIFLPVKIALFCWFAGAYTMSVFTPVYLKSKGFTIAHLSAFTATSVLLQCLSNVVSGIIVDKTGRSKPVLMIYFVIFFIISLVLTQMPSLRECNENKIHFQCSEDKEVPNLMIEASCIFFKYGTENISCALVNKTNLNDSSLHKDCKNLKLISSVLNIVLIKNETAIDSNVCNYDVNLQNQAVSAFELCDNENCKSFEMNCTNGEFLKCNSGNRFWVVSYGIMINLLYFSYTTTYRLFDVIVSDLTTQHDADFGRQRVFSILGSLTGPPLTGFILQKSGFTGDHKYSLAFVSSSAFTLLSAFSMITVNVKSNVPATKIWKQALEMVKKPDVFLLFLLVVIMGSAFGFQITYSSWYLQDLGASDLLLGINRGMAGLYGLPFLYSSRWFIVKFGERNLFVLGLLGHAVHVFLFSLLKEPWFAVAIQSTIVITYHLFWVAVMYNIEKIAPGSLQATIKILAGTLHFNVGKIIATSIGGPVMSILGGRVAYQVMGSIVFLYAIMYGIYVVILHATQKRSTNPENLTLKRKKSQELEANIFAHVEENQVFTISFLGRYKVRINKKLLPIKLSLFCWFGGTRIITIFIPVYLKHQDLTITNLSTFIAISVGFEFFFSMISGMLADRTGRVKPILFIQVSVYLATLICFIIMPKIDKCVATKTIFECFDGNIYHFIAKDSCQIFPERFYTDICSAVTTSNATFEDENESCSHISLLQKAEIIIEKEHVNETSDLCLYHVNFTNYLNEGTPPCGTTNCKTFEIVCFDNAPASCYYNRMFWVIIYAILFVLNNTSRTNVHRFFDVISADMAKQHHSDYGKQRLWSLLGASAGPALAGLVLDKTTSNADEKNYVPVFICSIMFTIVSIVPIYKANPKFHKPVADVCKKSFELMTNLDTFLFCILVLTAGISFGFQMIYGNLYLLNLGATNLLLGVSKGVSIICALPFLYKSKWFIKKIGICNVFVISLLSYVFYCFAFSMMREPWLAIGFELVNIAAYHLFYVAVIQFCEEIAPGELQATMKALAGSLHFNIAKIGAAIIGGFIMNSYGGRMSYKILGCIALVYAIIYGTYLIIKRLNKKTISPTLNWDNCETGACIRQNRDEVKGTITTSKSSCLKELITEEKK